MSLSKAHTSEEHDIIIYVQKAMAKLDLLCVPKNSTVYVYYIIIIMVYVIIYTMISK